MGAFNWIASLRSQRRAVKYNHRAYLDSRHGEAHRAAAIQKTASPTLRSVQLVFIRTVGMGAFAWVASAFHASQRRGWRNFSQHHNHYRRHGEARQRCGHPGQRWQHCRAFSWYSSGWRVWLRLTGLFRCARKDGAGKFAAADHGLAVIVRRTSGTNKKIFSPDWTVAYGKAVASRV